MQPSSSEDHPQNQKRKPVLSVKRLLTGESSPASSTNEDTSSHPKKERRRARVLPSRRTRDQRRAYARDIGVTSTDTEEDQRIRNLYRQYAAKLRKLPAHQALEIEYWSSKPLPTSTDNPQPGQQDKLEDLWTKWRAHFDPPSSAEKKFRIFFTDF